MIAAPSPTSMLRLALVAALGWTVGCQAQGPKPVREPRPLGAEEQALARAAVRYLERERQPTGLVSSNASFPATTMWDAASQLAGMAAARELGLMPAETFDDWMARALSSLARLPLYRGELPNKAYHAATLVPVDYGKLDRREEIGFSALDLGRLALWLDLISHRYPRHQAACRAVTARWKLERLVRDGEMMGAHLASGREAWNQEGRLGYEQYAAYGLSKLGLKLEKALDPQANATIVTIEDGAVPADRREARDSVAPNYVTSEPYMLDGLESGYRALPVAFAGMVLTAQQKRHARTGILTAWSEDSLDQAPWFTYNCLYVNGQAWKTLDADGRPADRFRSSSTKAAVGWHMLFRTPYTEQVYAAMRNLYDPERGVYAGAYEAPAGTNRAIALNTCAIVLESLLYAKLGQPLEEWAHAPQR